MKKSIGLEPKKTVTSQFEKRHNATEMTRLYDSVTEGV